MEVTAVDTENDVRAPPPFECRPGSGPDFYSGNYSRSSLLSSSCIPVLNIRSIIGINQQGYWDTNFGTEMKNTPYANTAGRIDIEGEDFEFAKQFYKQQIWKAIMP